MKYAWRDVPSRRHSYQPSAGMRQRRRENEGAYAFAVATVSARALIIRAAPLGSLAQAGTSPQRATLTTRPRSLETLTTGTGSVGATLYLGARAPSVSSRASKNAARSTALLVVAYRPHMPPTLSVRARAENVSVPHAPATSWAAPVASGPVNATVRLPGSKSMTARALILAAISVGPSSIASPLRARDTELMAAGLRA